MTPGTPRRGGYDEVWMDDPRMSFREGERSISLKRISGGRVQFALMTHDLTGPAQYQPVHIRTKEQFNALWQALMKLSEVTT